MSPKTHPTITSFSSWEKAAISKKYDAPTKTSTHKNTHNLLDLENKNPLQLGQSKTKVFNSKFFFLLLSHRKTTRNKEIRLLKTWNTRMFSLKKGALVARLAPSLLCHRTSEMPKVSSLNEHLKFSNKWCLTCSQPSQSLWLKL